MKTLKAKILHPKKQTLKISDLTYNQHYHKYNVKLDQGVDKINDIMEQPIEVFKHKISKTPRMGVGGKIYEEKTNGRRASSMGGGTKNAIPTHSSSASHRTGYHTFNCLFTSV